MKVPKLRKYGRRSSGRIIYTAGTVYVLLALVTTLALGGPGLEKFLETSAGGILVVWADLSAAVATLWAGLSAAVATLLAGLSAAVASLWAGLSAAVASLGDKLPELVDQPRKSAVSIISEPWHLAVFYSALLVLACYRNWEETKNVSRNVFEVVVEVMKAVWAVLSDPKRMVYYALFVIIVRTTPEVIENLSASKVKSAKMQ